MADDIVKQLEWLRDEFYDVDGVTSVVEVAISEIERLRRELEDERDELSRHRIWLGMIHRISATPKGEQ